MVTIPFQQVSILAGASGAGKSTLLTQEVAAWAKGEPFTGIINWPPNIERIAYLVADRTKDEIEGRFTDLGVGSERIELYGIQDDLTFNLNLLNEPDKALRGAVGRFSKPFQMLVIDPIAIFIDENTNDFRKVAISLLKMGRFAIERGITILATHHATKQRTDFSFKRPQDRISGSGAFQGFSGTQMVLIEGMEDGAAYDTLWVKSHTLPPMSSQLTRGEKGLFVSHHSKEQAEGGDYAKFEQFVSTLTTVTPITSFHAWGDSNNLSHPTIFRWITRMVSENKLKKTSRGLYERVEEVNEL